MTSLTLSVDCLSARDLITDLQFMPMSAVDSACGVFDRERNQQSASGLWATAIRSGRQAPKTRLEPDPLSLPLRGITR